MLDSKPFFAFILSSPLCFYVNAPYKSSMIKLQINNRNVLEQFKKWSLSSKPTNLSVLHVKRRLACWASLLTPHRLYSLSSWQRRTCRLVFMVSCDPAPPPQCSWFSERNTAKRKQGEVKLRAWISTRI